MSTTPLLLLLLALQVALSGAADEQVPVFLKHLVDEADGQEVALAASTSWHPTARSVAPLSVVTGMSSLTLQFPVPDDDWSVSGRRHCLLVLSPRKTAAPGGGSLTVSVGGGAGSSWRLSQRLAPAQSFLRFNLTQHVDPRRQRQLALELSVWDAEGRSVAPGDAVIVAGVELGPLFIVTGPEEVPAGPLGRGRRTLLNAFLPTTLPGCRLEPWTVRPSQLGWRHVVYPQMLLLNLCLGQCPQLLMHDSLKPSNHAVARNLYKALNTGDAQRHPDIHCVPIRFRQTSLLLELNEGNYSVVVSQDLSAVDCGCR